MTRVVLVGVGSSIVVDVEESLHRAGLVIAAGIRNRPGPCYVSGDTPILVPDEIPPEWSRLSYLVPIFTPAHRQTAAREAERWGLRCPCVLVDPTATVPRRLDLGPGTYINAGCTIGACSRFGVFAFVNRGASIGHHAAFEDFVSIGPGAVIAGHVAIGTGGVVAAGATVLPRVAIGANAVVGAGAVVTRDVPAGCLVLGNPARIVRTRIGGYQGLAVS